MFHRMKSINQRALIFILQDNIDVGPLLLILLSVYNCYSSSTQIK